MNYKNVHIRMNIMTLEANLIRINQLMRSMQSDGLTYIWSRIKVGKYQYPCFESCQFRSCSVFFVSWHLKCQADDFRCLRYYGDNVNISQTQMRQIISNCNMATPRKRQNKYWCSVPHCLSDNRNISRRVVAFSFHDANTSKERKQILF